MPDIDVNELVKQHQELGEMIEKLGGKVTYPENDDADLKAKKSAKKSAPEEDVKKAKKKGKGKDDTSDEYDDMDDDSENEDADVEKKAKKMVKAEDDEEVVFKGQTIRKSAVGEVQFGLVKGMAEEIAKNSEDIQKAKNEATLAKLEKRADDEFAHVPGTTQERAAMLKAVSEMAEPLKKTFEAVFKQSEALAKNAFEMKGTNGGDSEDLKKARTDFQTKVSEIKKRDNLTGAQAMSKARQEHPDLFKAYQDSQN